MNKKTLRFYLGVFCFTKLNFQNKLGIITLAIQLVYHDFRSAISKRVRINYK